MNYWERLKELEIRSLQRRREMLIIMHVFKIKINVIKLNVYPNTIDLNFKISNRTNAIKTVLKPLPRVQGKLLTLYEESFIIKAAKLWNILPPNITHISSLNSFKHELTNFLNTVPDEPPLPGYPFRNNNSLLQQCF